MYDGAARARGRRGDPTIRVPVEEWMKDKIASVRTEKRRREKKCHMTFRVGQCGAGKGETLKGTAPKSCKNYLLFSQHADYDEQHLLEGC